MEKSWKTCPRCGEKYFNYSAISRKDNKTKICPACGVKEAFEEHYKLKYEGDKYWKEEDK